ncbi:S1 RNA-binding domain-containing protein [Nitrincola schmidtii]|uniref:CvfB family protein n=1 Tax=Nitrincola schmidtii TaxID=1730894 RepID=UPI00124E31EC|nr:S1-like domain-containing RNA-binding protein [Nitrincola schmidtii]
MELGRINQLTVKRVVEQGAYLEAANSETVLLPTHEVPEGLEVGDELSVFVYLDSDDFPVATLKVPRIQRGEFAQLRVADTNDVGAFLDWGLPKQLFMPFAEQPQRVEVGQQVIVAMYIDNSGRLAASARLERHLNKTIADYRSGDPVSLMIWRRTELGFLTIINHQHIGLLHQQDLFKPVRAGLILPGYIKQVREEDGKIDVMLDKPGYGKVEPLAQQIIDYLNLKGGSCPLNDKSSPDEIKALFGVSKKAFKMAIGNLLKQGIIAIEEHGIRLR